MKNGFNRSSTTKILFGLILLVIGVIFAGNALGIWDLNIFFKGWWSVLIMICAVAGICSHGFTEGDIFLFLIGAVIFVKYRFEGIGKYITWKLFFAVLIIYIALRIIISAVIRTPKFSVSSGDSAKIYCGVGYERLSFGSKNLNYDGQNFEGGNFSVTFGELCIDLRGAAISEGAVINVNATFGRAIVRTPADLSVSVTKTDVAFGNVKNSAADRRGEHSVVINAGASFGSVEIY